MSSAVAERTTKPVDPKQGKGGKTVVKAIDKMVKTKEGHQQVHMKQPEELKGVLKALQFALGSNENVFTEAERLGAERVRERLAARLR